jgi:hypothetical protein
MASLSTEIRELKVGKRESFLTELTKFPRISAQWRDMSEVARSMKSLEQIEGVWPEPEFPSGLVLRCHAARKKPIDELSDLELATLLSQNIGIKHILPEAIRRLSQNRPDGTEYFDGQLREAVDKRI